MPIVGGLDIHRRQITFDYLDTETGRCAAGRSARPTGSTCGPGWPGSPASMTSRSRWRDARAGGMSPRNYPPLVPQRAGAKAQSEQRTHLQPAGCRSAAHSEG
jgi:hypothetical protein